MEVAVRQAFGFQQKPQSVNGVFKVSLGRSFGALLQFKKLIFDLFGIQLGRQGFKMQCQGCHMPGIIVERSGAPAQNGNISFEALQEFGKTVNFARSTIEKFVRP